MSNHDGKYTVTSTSRITGKVGDVELSVSPHGLARKVLRPEIIENPTVAENTVKICLVHQKRKTVDTPWSDVPGRGLDATTVLTPSKFQLDSQETHDLLRHLAALYQVGERGVSPGQVVLQIANQDEVIKTDAPRALLINKLLASNHGEEIWRMLVSLEPDLAAKLVAAQLHAARRAALEEFEAALDEVHDEHYWNKLLSANSWIFGNQVVAIIRERRIDINNFTDLPFEVDGGFMDVVELKRPDHEFWSVTNKGGLYRYRDKFLIPHYELSGAIAQTQAYILQAEKRVADSDFHATHGVTPLKPRGLVVTGRSKDWETEQWTAFRLLNDSLHGIQAMTFDHLLVQGKRMLSMTTAEQVEENSPSSGDDDW